MNDSSDAPTVRIAVGGDRAKQVLETARASADRARVLKTGPTGAPGGPYVYVTVDSRTALHGAVTPGAIERILEQCEAGVLPTGEAEAVGDGDEPPRTESGPLSVGVRRVLDGCGWHEPDAVSDPVTPDVEASPHEALESVEQVGLLGRGRADVAADEPLTAVWNRTMAADGEPVLVVHINDADPESNADRHLGSAAAGRLWDAASAVAAVVGIEDIVAFVPETDPQLRERLELVGEWHLASAPEQYRLGEPTMALESLEGNDRIEARRRPPGPEEWGLYGRPTLVHTPRTLLQVAELWRQPDAFDVDSADPGTRLVTVGGDVPEPALLELSTGTSLSRVLAAVEAPENTRYVVGGRFGGLSRTLDVPVGAQSLSAAGLGTDGVVEVLGPGHCVVATVGERAAFAREENCGRCVPCREGSKQLHESLRNVYEGEFDGEGLRELSRVMASTSLCAFGETAARPVRTALEDFESEFRAHANGRCPAGACGGLR